MGLPRNHYFWEGWKHWDLVAPLEPKSGPLARGGPQVPWVLVEAEWQKHDPLPGCWAVVRGVGS